MDANMGDIILTDLEQCLKLGRNWYFPLQDYIKSYFGNNIDSKLNILFENNKHFSIHRDELQQTTLPGREVDINYNFCVSRSYAAFGIFFKLTIDFVTRLEVRPLSTMKNSQHNNHIRSKARIALEEEAQINQKLPKELLLRIFSFLDVIELCRCAQVSKSWNLLALDGSNWKKINLFDFQTDIEGAVVENIARRAGGFLKQLSLRGCQSVGDSAMKTFSQQCHNIEDLNLETCKRITDVTCICLSRNGRKLQRLDLTSCSIITDESLKALGEGCPNLVHINISWCDNITERGISCLTRGCPKLQTFIAKSRDSFIDNECISHLANNCPLLEVVNVRGALVITDDAILRLAQNCPNIHYLCITGCCNLTDSTLLALAQYCHKLSTLEATNCSQFTDNGFQALAKNCHYLEKMDLEDCVLITDSTLSCLASGCPRLEQLTLSHCELITDDGIRQLGMAPCAAEHLTILELDNCPLITDASLEHLVACHNLQRIELYDCQLITRAGIRRLRNHLPNIRVHAYFAPMTPPPPVGGSRQRYCRCCVIL